MVGRERVTDNVSPWPTGDHWGVCVGPLRCIEPRWSRNSRAKASEERAAFW